MQAFALLTAVAGVASIYSDDHWDHATKVTDLDHFNKLVETAVSGEHHLMAPAWDAVTKMKKFSNVVFADVNLKDAPIREAHLSVGVGGWPTIRYFNSRTGTNGLSYVQKTEEAMCTELGPGLSYMEDFIDAVESGVADTWDREPQRIAAEAAAAAAILRQLKIQTSFINNSGRQLSKSWISPRGQVVFQMTMMPDDYIPDNGKHNDKFTFVDDGGCSFTHTNNGEMGVEFTVIIHEDDVVCPAVAEVTFENNSGQTLQKYYKLLSTKDELAFQETMPDGEIFHEQSRVTHTFVFHTIAQSPCTFSYTVPESEEDRKVVIKKEDLVCPTPVYDEAPVHETTPGMRHVEL